MNIAQLMSNSYFTEPVYHHIYNTNEGGRSNVRVLNLYGDVIALRLKILGYRINKVGANYTNQWNGDTELSHTITPNILAS